MFHKMFQSFALVLVSGLFVAVIGDVRPTLAGEPVYPPQIRATGGGSSWRDTEVTLAVKMGGEVNPHGKQRFSYELTAHEEMPMHIKHRPVGDMEFSLWQLLWVGPEKLRQEPYAWQSHTANASLVIMPEGTYAFLMEVNWDSSVCQGLQIKKVREAGGSSRQVIHNLTSIPLLFELQEKQGVAVVSTISHTLISGEKQTWVLGGPSIHKSHNGTNWSLNTLDGRGCASGSMNPYILLPG